MEEYRPHFAKMEAGREEADWRRRVEEVESELKVAKSIHAEKFAELNDLEVIHSWVSVPGKVMCGRCGKTKGKK